MEAVKAKKAFSLLLYGVSTVIIKNKLIDDIMESFQSPTLRSKYCNNPINDTYDSDDLAFSLLLYGVSTVIAYFKT